MWLFLHDVRDAWCEQLKWAIKNPKKPYAWAVVVLQQTSSSILFLVLSATVVGDIENFNFRGIETHVNHSPDLTEVEATIIGEEVTKAEEKRPWYDSTRFNEAHPNWRNGMPNHNFNTVRSACTQRYPKSLNSKYMTNFFKGPTPLETELRSIRDGRVWKGNLEQAATKVKQGRELFPYQEDYLRRFYVNKIKPALVQKDNIIMGTQEQIVCIKPRRTIGLIRKKI